MATPNPAPRRTDQADVVEDVGAAVAAEYYAVEAVAIAAVAAALRDNGPNDPATMRRLTRQGATLAADLHPERLAARAVHAGAVSGARTASAATGLEFTLDARVIIETGSLVDELNEALSSLNGPIAGWMPAAYRRASGFLSTQEKAEAIAQRYLASGIPGKRYANGRWMPIGSYAEMVARTVTHQAAIVGATVTQQQAGLQLCAIITAVDACASCAQNAGKVWSLDGTPAGIHTVQNAVGGGTVDIEVAGPLAAAAQGHFRGPNCRCQIAAVQGGVPVPRGGRHDPQAEAERDRQRALERDIRRWKAREAAALDDTQRQQARAGVRRAQARMRSFIDDTGRNRRGYREQLAWQTGPALVADPVAVGSRQ